jgi:hypothetical protein
MRHASRAAGSARVGLGLFLLLAILAPYLPHDHSLTQAGLDCLACLIGHTQLATVAAAIILTLILLPQLANHPAQQRPHHRDRLSPYSVRGPPLS